MTDDDNPFTPPDANHLRRYSPSRDPSVEHEPHHLDEEFLPDEASQTVPVTPPSAQDEAVKHTVWDEPALSRGLVSDSQPGEALTYEQWLQAKIQSTSRGSSQRVTVLLGIVPGIAAAAIALAIGLPWTVAATFNMLGSIVEELIKIAAATWFVEKRPYLFKSEAQILAAVAGSGLVFAITNTLLGGLGRLPWLGGWGWTAFALMHIACSASAALGLIRAWQDGMHNVRRPQLATAAPFFVLASAIHVLYGLLQ